MNRITRIEIAGTEYPLAMTTRGLKSVYERFGNSVDLQAELASKPPMEQLDIALWLLALMMEQGAEYTRIFEGGDTPEPLSEDDLAIRISINDIEVIFEKVIDAINLSMTSEVQVESPKKKKKLPWMK